MADMWRRSPTLAGMLTAVSASDHLNTVRSMVRQSLPNVTADTLRHMKNVPWPSVTSLPGNTTRLSDEQCSKAKSPTDRTPCGMTMPVSLSAWLKALGPIATTSYTTPLCFTLAGISTVPLTVGRTALERSP